MDRNIREQFMKDGYLVGLDMLTEEEVEFFYRSFLAYEERMGGHVKGEYRFKTHLLLPWMHQLVTHPKILDIVTQIFGPDILCWSTDLFPKEPGTGKVCAWHQDATYVGMDPPDALTVWVALTTSDSANGCGQLEHNKTYDEKSMLLFGQEIPVEVDESTVHEAVLKPGQASVHHIMTVHASGPNTSTGRRIGIAIRYCGAYIKQNDGIGDSAMLVAGKDHGTFPLESVPCREFGPDEVEAHRKAVGAVGPEDLIAVK
ncbi:HTXA-like protein [Mya arenaria]|uniref:HTXA-like protein n=1 Tax=Mya arenaria TaxID=6604 RepID=A0ABY7EIU5_MYAAR|nr:HTXA-like protein [Mya arenaria]